MTPRQEFASAVREWNRDDASDPLKTVRLGEDAISSAIALIARLDEAIEAIERAIEAHPVHR